MIFQFFITEKCNLNCRYCFEGEKKYGEMQETTINASAQFMKKYVKQDFVIDKEIWVNFNGGEALLRKDFIKKAVGVFLDNDIKKFSISTNFTLCDNDFLDFLAKNNFTIQLSIDGEKETHDRNRVDYNNKGTFDAVWENIEYLNNNYQNINVLYSMVFTPETCEKLYRNVKFLTDRIKNAKIISSYNSKDSWEKKDINQLKRQLKKIRKLYVRKIKTGESIYIKSLSKKIFDTINNKKSTCGCCKDLIGIKSDGDVIACGAFLGNKDEKKFKIGSVFDNNLDTELIKNLISIKIDNDTCNDCNLISRCDNDCLVCNYDCSGDLKMPSFACCEINKLFIKECDKAIMQLRKNVYFNELLKRGLR